MELLTVKINDLKDVNHAGFPWMLLGAVYLLFSFVGGVNSNLWFTLLFGMGFASVAVLLYQKKATFVSGLLAAAIPTIGVVASLGHIDMLLGAGLGVLMFALLLAGEFGVYKVGKESGNARYFVFGPYVLWLIWSALYLYNKIVSGSNFGLATVLSVAGVFLVSADGLLNFTMKNQIKKQTWVSRLKWIGLLMVTVALALNFGLGWSLSLVG